MEESAEEHFEVALTESELRYIVAAGFGLLQNIPEKSLPTYVSFSKEEIIEFTKKVRRIMDEHDLSM